MNEKAEEVLGRITGKPEKPPKCPNCQNPLEKVERAFTDVFWREERWTHRCYGSLSEREDDCIFICPNCHRPLADDLQEEIQLGIRI
jgi:hypothetical protein